MPGIRRCGYTRLDWVTKPSSIKRPAAAGGVKNDMKT